MSAAPGVSEALLTCGSVRKTRAKALVNPKRQYLASGFEVDEFAEELALIGLFGS